MVCLHSNRSGTKTPGVLICCYKHCDPKPLGEERLYFILQFIACFEGSQGVRESGSQGVREGTQGRKKRPRRKATSWHAQLAFFKIQPRTTQPGVAPPRVGWALPHQSREFFTVLLKVNLMEAFFFSVEFSFFPFDCDGAKLMKANQHTPCSSIKNH